MNKSLFLIFIVSVCFFTSCQRQQTLIPEIAMIQIVDRLGMNETIKEKEKIELFSHINFEDPQPYQKVVRVMGKKGDKTHKTIITTYHDNGFLKEYLEAVSNRAKGIYREFYPDGTKKIEAFVMEGVADLTESAKLTFLFEGDCTVYSPNGQLEVIFPYKKGKLSGNVNYYYENKMLKKTLPYEDDFLNGEAQFFDKLGTLLGSTNYQKGKKHGKSIFVGDQNTPYFEEFYDEGRLIDAIYYDFDKKEIARIENGFGKQIIFENKKLKKEIEYQNGYIEGVVKNFYPSGNLESQHQLHQNAKHGPEWLYFDEKQLKPKLFLTWYQDELHGSQKSWYSDGNLESQREMIHNVKHGQLIAWYRQGGVMMIEEYEQNKLKQGAYFHRGNQDKASEVIDGKGLATIFDADGFFLQKVRYEKGEIVNE